MNNGFCTRCGAKLVDNADFCNNCGAQIEHVDGVPRALPTKTDSYPEEISPAKAAPLPASPSPPKYRPIRQRPKVIGYAFGIIFLISVPFIVFAILGTINLSYMGDLTFEVDSFAETNVLLDVDLDVGSLDIIYDPTLTNLIEATLEVWGRPGADIADAKNFRSYNETGMIRVSFDSGDRSFWYWDKKTFNYNIELLIHPSANVNFHVKAGTASITLDTSGEDYLEINGLLFDSGTGSIGLNLAGSLNTTFQSIYLNTGTGSINANLGKYTYINDTEVKIITGTGTITLTYEDLISNHLLAFILDTGTGSIYINIIQNLVLPDAHATTISADTGTGSVSVDIELAAAIGLKIHAATGTGSKSLFGYDNSDYESPNYETADNVYNLLLETGTGSITVV